MRHFLIVKGSEVVGSVRNVEELDPRFVAKQEAEGIQYVPMDDALVSEDPSVLILKDGKPAVDASKKAELGDKKAIPALQEQVEILLRGDKAEIDALKGKLGKVKGPK